MSTETEGNFDLGRSRKKYSCHCQFLRSKKCRYAVSQKVFHQSSQGLVQMQWGLEWECIHPIRFLNRRNFWSGLSTKKELMSLSIFALKKCRHAVSRKNFFNIVKNLVKWNEGSRRSELNLVGAEIEGIFDLGCLRKIHSCRCQTLRSKKCRHAVSQKVYHQSSQGFVQIKWGLV